MDGGGQGLRQARFFGEKKAEDTDQQRQANLHQQPVFREEITGGSQEKECA